MLGPQIPTEPGARNVGGLDAATALAIFHGSAQQSFPQLHSCASQQNSFGHVHPAYLQDRFSMLKRKRSVSEGVGQLQKASEGSQAMSHGKDSEDSPEEQKRTKLGYHRTSIACGHCRRRKIRCLVPADGDTTRCSNCIRLKKECSFHPVDQSAPNSKSKQKKSKANSTNSASKRPIALSPTSTVPPPRRGFSVRSDKYPKLPSSTKADFQALQDNKSLSSSFDPSNSEGEHYPNLYAPQIGPTFMTPGFRAMSDQGQFQQMEFPANAQSNMWDPTVSPASQSMHPSPSWQNLNRQATMTSSQQTFTPPAQKLSSWSRAQRSVSHPAMRPDKGYTSLTGSPYLTPAPTDPSQFEYQQMLANNTLMQVTGAEAVTMPMQTTISEMSVPAMSMSQHSTPFMVQESWPMFAEQQDTTDHNPSYGTQHFTNPWYQM